jgi:hypothetical protein
MPRPQRKGASPKPPTTRAYAASLRQQATAPAPVGAGPKRSPDGPWSPVSGQVRREQEAWLGRTAGGTRLLVGCAFVAPLLVGVLTTSAGMDDVMGGVLAALMLLMLPLAFLVVLMSLGGGGPLGFMGRAVGNSVYVSSSLTRGRGQQGGPGRVLILSTSQGELRVAVARAIDLPIGATVTVRGPRFGGYLHAWTIQADGLDPRPLLTRGVLPALVIAGLGLVLTVTQFLGALAGAVT